MRVLIGCGTRPEAIKLAPVVLALRGCPDIEPILLATGQHEEQLDHALGVFGLEPDINLRAMRPRQPLEDLARRILPGASRHLRELGIHYVVVQGDTLSTFAIALAAFLQRLPVAHVEAGLRSHDMQAPFPEEASRRMTSVLADLHLAPTPEARANLLAEGLDPERILVTGQTGVDALHYAVARGRIPDGLGKGPYVTVTIHRRENWPRLGELAHILLEAARRHPDLMFVMPLHRNPVVREAVAPVLSDLPNVALIDPLEYGAMAALLSRSRMIVTDSGGLQEEGTTLGVPVIVLREKTERPEGIATGGLRIAGLEADAVLGTIEEVLAGSSPVARAPASNPYGDGLAAQRVVAAIAWRLGLGERPAEWRPVRVDDAGEKR